MLADIKPTHQDFGTLASYLIHGDERPPNPNRVAWVFGHNLPTDDPILAAQYMAATAELSKRCKHACYHTVIAWAQEENPSPEVMQEIARRTLDLAGLTEHQALVMGHGDKPHPHLHMMVNRVHPTTGRAWATSNDYVKFDRIMRQLSEEFGFAYVPGHAFEPELTEELPKAPNSNATYAAKKGAPTQRPQWSRKASQNLGKAVSEDLGRASSWTDLEYRLAQEGLTLEAKGKGLIVGNNHSYAKLSALKLTTSAKELERRFGTTYADHRARRRPPIRNIWTVDAVDITKAVAAAGIADQNDVRDALATARGIRKARLAKAPLMKQIIEELREALKASTLLSTDQGKSNKRLSAAPRRLKSNNLRAR